MTVQSSTFEVVFGSDPLGRFTASIVTAVPQFDPGDTPIGHALAVEIFRREPVAPVVEDIEPETTMLPVVLAPERVYEWHSGDGSRRPSPRPRVVEEAPVSEEADEAAAIVEDLANDVTQDGDQGTTGTLLELPVGASSVEWFGITEPDEEIDEQARRAS